MNAVETADDLASKNAEEWGSRLAAKVRRVLEKFPDANPDNVRHTLILLEMSPEERLARSLLRGGAREKRKAAMSQAALLAGTMQLNDGDPLTPALSAREREKLSTAQGTIAIW